MCEEWHDFQEYGKWFDNNYYEIEGETMCLDKDILVKHNKIYSPETCIYAPQTINKLFTKRQNDRGESIIGTYPFKGKYVVQCSIINPQTGKSKKNIWGIMILKRKDLRYTNIIRRKTLKWLQIIILEEYLKDYMTACILMKLK